MHNYDYPSVEIVASKAYLRMLLFVEEQSSMEILRHWEEKESTILDPLKVDVLGYNTKLDLNDIHTKHVQRQVEHATKFGAEPDDSDVLVRTLSAL